MKRLPIKSFSSMREAYSVITQLESEYLKTNKRRSVIDLTLSSTSKPFHDERGRIRMGAEVIEINAVYDDKDATQVQQAEWIAGRAKELV